MPRMISLKEAVKESGLSYHCLRNLCLTGEVVHIRSGNKILINAEKLAKYLNGEQQDARMDKNT